MKFPRWLVIGMLSTSVLAVLAAAGWWWVTWPERTVRTFLHLVEDSRFEEANQLLTSRWEFKASGEVVVIGERQSARIIDPAVSFRETADRRLQSMPCSIFDVLAARREFRLARRGEGASAGWVFTVQRGRIQLSWDRKKFKFVRWQRDSEKGFRNSQEPLL